MRDGVIRRHTSPVRKSTATLVSSHVANSSAVRIEVLRRHGVRAEVQFVQPRPALVWERAGGLKYRMNVDGEKSELTGTSSTGFCFFPAFTSVNMEAELREQSDYAIAFFDDLPTTDVFWGELQQPLVGFRHPEIERSFATICREATDPDEAFHLLVDGWAMQVRGYLGRAMGKPLPSELRNPYKLGGPKRRRIEEYIRSNLCRKILVADLALTVGLGLRHFSRAFVDTFHQTPYQYILTMRLDQAKFQLLMTDLSITEIGLSCGFGHSQHFATAFKQSLGLSPSEYRLSGGGVRYEECW